MKRMRTLFLVMLVVSLEAVAQNNWQKNGNNATPIGFAPTIGSDATWNSQIKFITAGIDRMMLNPNVTNVINGLPALPRNGFVGIGQPIFFMPPPFATDLKNIV
jgi:hypothetical protein